MAETIDTYFDAWNATDDAERGTLIERCLTSDVELIDENGRFSGHDGRCFRGRRRSQDLKVLLRDVKRGCRRVGRGLGRQTLE